MSTEIKKQTVSKFQQEAKETTGLVITNYKGLKTVEFNELRLKLRPLKSEYRVVKNSLTKIALRNAGLTELADSLEGPTAVVLERGDVLATVKALFDFAKTHENIKIRGGVFEGKYLVEKDLKALANLPSREVLIAQLLGTLQAPLVNLVNVLQAPMRDLVNALDQVAKKSAE